jgi:pyruvate-ferredoxin/flavodoxin oxidoreductase
VATETRFAILERSDPEKAAVLGELAQADADERWRYYTQLAGIHRSVPHIHDPSAGGAPEGPPGGPADAPDPAAERTNGKGGPA